MFVETKQSVLQSSNFWVDVLLVFLALLSIGLLIFELGTDLTPPQIAIIHIADLVIALLFLADFMINIYSASDKGRFFRKNWPDLLASVPISESVFRVFRILRALRLIRMVRIITEMRYGVFDLHNSHNTTLQASRYIYASVITSIVILMGALGFFTLELNTNPNVEDFFDALWWSIVTVTTVGYGDIFPVTAAGRVLAIALMFFGVALVGAIAGIVGSYYVRKRGIDIIPPFD